MKIKREETFKNVVITLENQVEVDVLFSIINFTPISYPLKTTDAKEFLSELWEKMGDYKTSGYDKYHRILDNNLERIK